MNTKIKIFLISVYFLISLLLILTLLIFDIDQKSLLELISKDDKNLLLFQNIGEIKFTIIFVVFSILWSFFLGFGFVLIIITALFYDVLLGTFLLVISKTIGSTLMYFVMKNYFNVRIQNYLIKKKIIDTSLYGYITKNKFKSFVALRLIPGTPGQLIDLLPLMFNLNYSIYFLSKFFGSFFSNLILVNTSSVLFQKFNIKSYDSSHNLDLNLILSTLLIFILILLGIYIKKRFKL